MGGVAAGREWRWRHLRPRAGACVWGAAVPSSPPLPGRRGGGGEPVPVPQSASAAAGGACVEASLGGSPGRRKGEAATRNGAGLLLARASLPGWKLGERLTFSSPTNANLSFSK